MKLLLVLTAILEAPVGLLLFIAPSVFTSVVLGGELGTPAGSVAGRIAGGAILALAIVCWQGRNGVPDKTAMAIVAAMLFYNAAVNLVLVYGATALGIQSPLLSPVIAVHLVMGFWCLLILVRSQRKPESN